MAILAETHNGQLRIQGNEVIIDAKDADASKFRVGSRNVPGESGGGGAYSFDVITEVKEGNRRVEAAVLVGGFNGKTGEVGLSIWNGRDANNIEDADQKKVMEFRADEVEFKVPVKGLKAVASAPSAMLKNGKYEFHLQSDRNLVLYDTSTTPWTAVWSSGTHV